MFRSGRNAHRPQGRWALPVPSGCHYARPMPANQQTPRTEHLGAHDCWSLLRTVSVGRLAVWAADHPEIFPVNYVVDHGSLVFRTAAGTKLSAVLGGPPVAFEADGVNANSGVAWSVIVKGKAEEVHRGHELLETVSLLLFPWEAGPKDHFVRIVPESVSGRRFTVTPPGTWWLPLNGQSDTAVD